MQHVVFCKQCWQNPLSSPGTKGYLNPLVWPGTKDIVWVEQDKDGTQLFRGGKAFGAKYFGMSFQLPDGKMVQGIPAYCDRGHLNIIEDTPEQIAEQKRLEYNFGQLCPYHDKHGAHCNRRHPCEICQVWKNYKELKATWNLQDEQLMRIAEER
jgi:hypothetical protein